ncbi:MAG: DUF3800 domain-containing protein, partial [Candidatus Thiodiazotropha sp. (ex. Lucinisca nassula)]|nr:DUF3800 domain-containing protein [Candidatus Thiodiazotropha sp. (ex. Lucinisca nassula)]
MTDSFSDYLVFVDESGDHGLDTIDPSYPVFVLAFCIFKKRDYIEHLVPAIQEFKFRHFGHDQVILHEVDMRKDRGDFTFLKTRERKETFMQELSAIVETTPFTLITTVIRKEDYKQRYHFPDNPYHVALGFGLERIFYFLRSHACHTARTHVIVEKR